MNLPNSITMSRVACVPLLLWILSPGFPWAGGHGATGLRGGEQELIASAVFILASITDGLDGYLARKRGQITTHGHPARSAGGQADGLGRLHHPGRLQP